MRQPKRALKMRTAAIAALVTITAMSGCSALGFGGDPGVEPDELRARVEKVTKEIGSDQVTNVTVNHEQTYVTVWKDEKLHRKSFNGKKFVDWNTYGDGLLYRSAGPASDLPMDAFSKRLKEAKSTCEKGQYNGSLTRLLTGAWFMEIGCVKPGVGPKIHRSFVNDEEIKPVGTLASKDQFKADLELMHRIVPKDSQVVHLALTREHRESFQVWAPVKGCDLYFQREQGSETEPALSKFECRDGVAGKKGMPLSKLDPAKVAEAADQAVKKVGGWKVVGMLKVVELDGVLSVQAQLGPTIVAVPVS